MLTSILHYILKHDEIYIDSILNFPFDEPFDGSGNDYKYL